MNNHKINDTPEIGKRYTCVYNGLPVYTAEIQKTQGCWATIKVHQPIPGKYEKHYSPGQVMDIKMQFYDFIEE